MQKTTSKYPFLKEVIKQWPLRIRAAGLKNKQVAKLAGISECHFSQIINFKIDDPRLSTMQAVDDVLKSNGV